LTAGDKWACLSGISCTTGPACGAVGYYANSGRTCPYTSKNLQAGPGSVSRCQPEAIATLGAFPYERAVGDQDPFAVIGQLALDAGCGVSGLVGKAVSHLLPAGPLVRFGIEWLSKEFGPRRSPEQE
jgi:hypothetical protein